MSGGVCTGPSCQPLWGLLADASCGQSLPAPSGVREVTQSSIHQRLTHACYPVELAEACGFELCYPGHALEFKLHSDTVLPLEVKKFINTNPFGHEKVASLPLRTGPATAERRGKVGPRCGVWWPVEQGSLVRLVVSAKPPQELRLLQKWEQVGK